MDSDYSSPCQINLSGYAEAFRPVQSDSQTSEWYSYFKNDVLLETYMDQNGGCKNVRNNRI